MVKTLVQKSFGKLKSLSPYRGKWAINNGTIWKERREECEEKRRGNRAKGRERIGEGEGGLVVRGWRECG